MMKRSFASLLLLFLVVSCASPQPTAIGVIYQTIEFNNASDGLTCENRAGWVANSENSLDVTIAQQIGFTLTFDGVNTITADGYAGEVHEIEDIAVEDGVNRIRFLLGQVYIDGEETYLYIEYDLLICNGRLLYPLAHQPTPEIRPSLTPDVPSVPTSPPPAPGDVG